MATGDAAQRQEQQRREDAYFARAAACNMSNAKWRKFFAVAATIAAGPLRWKFVRDDRIFSATAPPLSSLRDDGLGDVMPSPYAAFREIDWIEVPQEYSTGWVETLAAVGQFPIQHLPSGLRVMAYTWQPPQ
jgi:hypothetical protein